MTEHLPECCIGSDDDYFNSWMVDECICDRLRACEQRCDEKRHAEVRAWSELSRDNFDHGFAAGLDAAREVVEEMDLHGCHPYRFPDCNCLGPQVIAAIDALRKEK